MAAPETMVASSSRMAIGSHEVFISHRGIEMKKGFANHLYCALRESGITSFLDSEEFREGDDVREYLPEAIRRAPIHVPVFTKIYGTSPWCLDELVEILDRRRNHQAKVIPVFYDVEPEMLRMETGPFAERLGTYLQTCKCEEERIKRWKHALKEASYLVGFLPQKYGGREGEVIKALVAKIREEMNDRRSEDTVPKPVGLDVKIRNVVQRFRLHEKTGVYVVLIWGMGGVGKTTFVQAIYDRHKEHFEGVSFLENCGVEKAIHIQDRLRNDLLHDGSDMRGDIARGRERLRDGLRQKKVLIVLDDVHDFGNVEKSINLPRLCPGSLILLTSRDKKVYPHEKDLNSSFRGEIYNIPKMDKQNSVQLFCHHAFRSVNVDPGFEKLATEVVEACDGLPLALEVLGRYLSKMKTEKQWQEAVIKIRDNKLKGITDRLRISYDGLGKDEQEMFLDVACFLMWKKERTAKCFWDASMAGCETGLEELKQLCLVKVNGKGLLTMHDLLRDMGREISRSSKTRLWNDEDLRQLIDSNQGLDQIRGVVTSLPSLDVRELSKMQSLHLLFLNGTKLNGSWRGRKCPQIRWLSWKSCPHETLPKHLSSESLALLTIEFGKDGLSKFPSIITKSKKLNVMEIAALKRSSYTTLKWPRVGVHIHRLQNFGSLEVLAISGLSFITKLPSSCSQLKRLRLLSITRCHRLKELPEDIGSLESLVKLEASGLNSITKLPSSFGQLKTLRMFEVDWCDRLEELPEDIGSLERLEMFRAAHLKLITKLPSSFGQLKSLRFVYIEACDRLQELPEDLGSLESLKVLRAFDLRSITKLPSSLGQLNSLGILDISGIDQLKELPESLGSLENLEELMANGLKSMIRLPSSFCRLRRLWRLDIHECDSLEELPEDFGYLESLKILQAWGLKSMTKLPSSLGQLKKLEVLDIGKCDGLEELPEDFGGLESLKHLRASGRLRSVAELLGFSLKTLANDTDKPLKPQTVRSIAYVDAHRLMDTISSSYASVLYY